MREESVVQKCADTIVVVLEGMHNRGEGAVRAVVLEVREFGMPHL